MKLLKSIVRPNKVDEVKDALAKLNIAGMTVTEVRGHGKQKGHTAIYRGKEYNVSLLPKMEIEVVVPDSIAEDAIKGPPRDGDARSPAEVGEEPHRHGLSEAKHAHEGGDDIELERRVLPRQSER